MINKIMFITPEATVIDVVPTVINESSMTTLELDCEQSLICPKICGEECKSSEHASVTASVTHLPTSVRSYREFWVDL